MSSLKIGLAIVALAVLTASGFAVWYFVADGGGQGFHASGPRPGTVGARRMAILKEITGDYVAAGDKVMPRVAAGDQLAPPDILNKELADRGAKWRVREVDGLRAETYLVS